MKKKERRKFLKKKRKLLGRMEKCVKVTAEKEDKSN